MNVVVHMLKTTLLAATPILLAAVGGLYTYHADVFNIAMEGIILIGAFMGILGSYMTGSWVVGVLFALAGGVVIAGLFSFFAIYMQTDEFVTGIAVNMLALGGTTYALRQMFHVKGALIDPAIQSLPKWDIPLLNRIPVVGDIFNGHPFMVYVSILIVFLASYHLYRTPYGLRLRATGEDSRTVDSVGVHSALMKTSAIMISGILCSLGGVYLSLGYVTLFAENMSGGRGWISLAVIILTKGRPVNVLFMVLLFGFFDGLGLSLQHTAIPPQFTQMLPYIATLVALYFYSRKKKRQSPEVLKSPETPENPEAPQPV